MTLSWHFHDPFMMLSWRFHDPLWCFMMLHDASRCFMMLHDALWRFMTLHDASWPLLYHSRWCNDWYIDVLRFWSWTHWLTTTLVVKSLSRLKHLTYTTVHISEISHISLCTHKTLSKEQIKTFCQSTSPLISDLSLGCKLQICKDSIRSLQRRLLYF